MRVIKHHEVRYPGNRYHQNTIAGRKSFCRLLFRLQRFEIESSAFVHRFEIDKINSKSAVPE